MARSPRHSTRPPRAPRDTSEEASAASANAPRRRNVPPEPRQPEQPGTGTPALGPVSVTVRRSSRWRTRSGRVRRDWEIAFEPTAAPTPDPEMGWIQTTDPLAGHKVAFHTADAAIAFAKRKGWDVRVVAS